jgi:hypothetical protein
MSLKRSTFSLLTATAFLLACSSSPTEPLVPLLALEVTPAALTIELGATGESDVTVVRSSSTAAVTVSVSGGGTGVAAAVQGVAHDGDETTATVVVTVSGAAEPGDYTVTVKAANGDADDVTKPITVTVTEAEGGGEA